MPHQHLPTVESCSRAGSCLIAPRLVFSHNSSFLGFTLEKCPRPQLGKTRPDQFGFEFMPFKRGSEYLPKKALHMPRTGHRAPPLSNLPKHRFPNHLALPPIWLLVFDRLADEFTSLSSEINIARPCEVAKVFF